VPGVPPRVKIDPVPLVRPVVAAFGLVRAMIKFRLVPSALEQIPKNWSLRYSFGTETYSYSSSPSQIKVDSLCRHQV
jgi:hypothetical protein